MKQKYCKDNKETIRERARIYEKSNKDNIKDRKATYYLNNKDHILQRCRAYQERDPDKVKQVVEHGVKHLEFSMRLAKIQIENGLYFLFEHPAHATRGAESACKMC